jgi:hypothetical protein
LSLTSDQRDAVMRWAASVSAGAAHWRLVLNNRVVTVGAWDVGSMLDAIETAASLNGAVRTFVLVALDAQSEEIARTDVRVDPKALARAASADVAAQTQHVAATAQVIAATDHKSVSAAFKSNAEALGESHQALIAMVSAFGEAGKAMMQGNAQLTAQLAARATSDAQTIERLEREVRELRSSKERLEQLAERAMEEAERLKQEQRDFMLFARATFGDKVSEVAANFLAKQRDDAPKTEVPQ